MEIYEGGSYVLRGLVSYLLRKTVLLDGDCLCRAPLCSRGVMYLSNIELIGLWRPDGTDRILKLNWPRSD